MARYVSLKSLDTKRRVRIGADRNGGDVDSILEKYKHLSTNLDEKELDDCVLVTLQEDKDVFPNETDKEEDEMDLMDDDSANDGEGEEDDFELDEKEAELLMEASEKLVGNNEEVDEDLVNIGNCPKDDKGDLVNDCVEDTSDYLTEPEDDAEEEADTIVAQNKEEMDGVGENVKTEKVVLMKSHDGFDIENPGKQRKVKCNQCDWAGGQHGLNYHKKSKHLGIRFKCPHCEFSSPRKQYLSSHILTKHKEVVEKIIKRDATTLPVEDEEISEKRVVAEVKLEVNKAKRKFQKEASQDDHPSRREKLDKQSNQKKDAANKLLQHSKDLKDGSEKENCLYPQRISGM